MHKIVSVLENETHRMLRNTEILKDYLILAKWSDILTVNKKNKKNKKKSLKTCEIVDFTLPAKTEWKSKKRKER